MLILFVEQMEILLSIIKKILENTKIKKQNTVGINLVNPTIYTENGTLLNWGDMFQMTLEVYNLLIK